MLEVEGMSRRPMSSTDVTKCVTCRMLLSVPCLAGNYRHTSRGVREKTGEGRWEVGTAEGEKKSAARISSETVL